jgi:hypothetical protein
MAISLTLGVGVVYLIIAVDHFYSGRGALALTFFAYALANVGLAYAPTH